MQNKITTLQRIRRAAKRIAISLFLTASLLIPSFSAFAAPTIPPITGFTGRISINGQAYTPNCANCLQDTIAFVSGGTTINARQAGAAGNGITDDTAALQTAINTLETSGGGTLFIPSGTYIVDMATPIPATTPGFYAPRRSYALLIGRSRNIALVCENPATTIIKKKAGAYGNKDYDIISVQNSDHLAFKGCTFDGNMQNVTEGEQAHGIDIFTNTLINPPGKSSHIQVIGNRFLNIKGDGVRFVGTGDEVTNAVVARNTFLHARRSGIGVQRGLANAWLVENTFEDISDQSIDFEPTGTSLPPHDILIADSVMRQRADGKQATLAIGGIGSNVPAYNILVKNITLYGGLNVRNIENATFDNVVVDQTGLLNTGAGNALLINGTVTNIVFKNGKLIGKTNGGRINGHVAGTPPPTRVLFENMLITGQNKGLIFGAREVIVRNSVFRTTGSPPANSRGIFIESEAPGQDLNDYLIKNNTVTGFGAGVEVNGRSGNTIRRILITGTNFTGAIQTSPLLIRRGNTEDVTVQQ